MLIYRIIFSKKARKDLIKIAKFMKNYNYSKIIEKIYKNIENLTFMPRMHKTLIYFKDKKGEYRRIVSGKYIIIYKILEDKIIILRIFNQKENYLNQKSFILKENSEKYNLKIRRSNMHKLKTFKNSYDKLDDFNNEMTQEEYELKILDESVEKIKSGKAVFYTHEEFWKNIRKGTEKDYETISHNIRRKYV